jgi:uncharacterized protein (TIGR02246 family)
MIQTVLEASVAEERAPALQAAYAAAGAGRLPPGLVWTQLVRDAREPQRWRIQTWWASREALEAMRSAGTPAGVLMFRAAGAEPTLSVFEVAASLPSGDGGELSEATQLVHAFARCWNAHDMAAFAELFAENAQFVNVVGLWWRGRQEIREAHAFSHATMFRQSTLRIEETSARFVAPQLALVRARWTLRGHVSPDGTPLPERGGLLLTTLSRARGRWEIVDSQNTDIVEGVLSRPQ